MATHVAAASLDAAADGVALTLPHVHLPKLAAAGAVEYDHATRLVSPAEFP